MLGQTMGAGNSVFSIQYGENFKMMNEIKTKCCNVEETNNSNLYITF